MQTVSYLISVANDAKRGGSSWAQFILIIGNFICIALVNIGLVLVNVAANSWSGLNSNPATGTDANRLGLIQSDDVSVKNEMLLAVVLGALL